MGKQIYSSGNHSGFQYDRSNNANLGKTETNPGNKKPKADEDLIIEDNTVYEIDRECYERLKKQRRRKVQDKKNI
ncbi:MAG TPA: hypothetical protein VN258_07800 [Mobilitalea sp.]|nr:hypothetical protein [Mobilitalea sp.]